ncbi:MAG TPA: ABC transporter permease [Gemmatimonadaceae bacterium]
MLRGLWDLVWIEIKVFAREPMGAIGTVLIPVVAFMGLSQFTGGALESPRSGSGLHLNLPVFAAVLISINTVLSLVTIISIYREAGILKRLRATPLRSYTILSAHVIVKLLLTAMTLALLLLVGKRYYPAGMHVRVIAFTIALMIATVSILSIGFIIASIVPTARFAQPIGSAILYPMLGLSGLFFPISALPPTLHRVASVLPLTYAVSLLDGIWNGEAWSAHLGDMGALIIVFVVSTAISAKVFRWE